MTSFALTTSVFRVDRNVFRAYASKDWWVVKGLNGGWLAAVTLRAASESLGASRQARAHSLYYFAPAIEGDVTLQTRVLREGRTAGFVSVEAWQNATLLGSSLSVFATGMPSRKWDESGFPTTSIEQDHQLSPFGFAPPFTQNIWSSSAFLGSPQGSGDSAPALTGGLCWLVEPEPIDQYVLAAATDAWLPTVMVKSPGSALALTLELSMEFNGPFVEHPKGSELVVRFRSPICADGYFSEDGEIWDREGNLLVRSRQLAIVGEERPAGPFDA